jgi:hypothetical protein
MHLFKKLLWSAAWVAIPLWSHAATVTVAGRQLLVDGDPFTVKGVNYSPAPVGYQVGNAATGCIGPYRWWMDRPTYIADFPLIRKMGANTIRTFDLMNSTSTSTEVLAALDEAHRNNLGVIMGYFVSHTENMANGAFRTRTLNEFVAAVNAYKNHPAVLIWAFGNENNLDNGNTNPDWYSLVQQAAQQAKAADPYHAIMTVEGECLGPDCSLAPGTKFSFLNNIGNAAIGADDATLTFLDLWGINAYRGTTFEGIFQALVVSTMTAKPVLVTEFGKDAWRDSAGREDADMQSEYIRSQWQEINANLSATGMGTASLVGGSVFEWTDEWWKDSANDCNTHGTQVLFRRTSDSVDSNYQDEWLGLATASPITPITNTGGTVRTLRKAYSAIQAFWNPTAISASAAASRNFFAETVRNFPNPFRVGTDPTRFVALVNEAGTIDIRIYDASGQFVTGLPPVAPTGPGRYELSWDGRNRQGAYVSPGLYYASIEGKGTRQDKQFRRVVAVK